MSRDIWTSMYIGGILPRNMMDAFADIVDDTFSDQSTDPRDEFKDAPAENRSLLIQGHAGGTPHELVSFCGKYALTYWLHYEGYSGEFQACIEIWSPETGVVEECDAGSETYEPMIGLATLKADRDQGRSVEHIVDRLSRFSHKNVPQFELGADVEAAKVSVT